MTSQNKGLSVLLVRPPAPNILSFTKILDNEPLELEYLYTALKNAGHCPTIFDGLIDPTGFKATLMALKPDLVAITGYITQENLMLSYCQLVKTHLPTCITLLGGVHVQLNYERLYHPSVDYLCRSEDVSVLSDLCDLIGSLNSLAEIKSCPEALSRLNGLVWRNPITNAFQVNPLAPINIDTLPIPDRTFFNQHRQHYRYLDLHPVATIKTAFSCPFDCNFCYCTLLSNGQYQARNLDLVLDEIEGIDAPNIQIVDDEFMVNPQRVWAFISGLRARGIQKTFICYARADAIAKNPDLVAEMSKVGFKYFLVGLEAIDTSQLLDYNKKTTAEINRRCVEILGAQAPNTYLIALMIVSHEARPQDFENLYQWVKKHKLHYVTVSIFTPIPGTPLYKEYASRITSRNIEDWDFLHLVLEPTKMTRSQFYRAYYKLFLRLYRIARRTGIYDFMDLEYYRNLLSHFLTRQFK